MTGSGYSTDRLRVTPWGPALASPESRVALIDSLDTILTPKVLAPLPPSLHREDGSSGISDWIADRDAESDVYLVHTGGALIGLLILASFPEPGKPTPIHLGYLFSEAAWGKGYATEMLQGLVGWYRTKRAPVMLLGGVETTNPASARVLQKAGLTRDVALSSDGTDMFTLRL